MTVSTPSATLAASPAVFICQWIAPTLPGWWHDEQWSSRIGMTTFENDGPGPEAFCVGPLMVLGMATFAGSTAWIFRVITASLDADTSPWIETCSIPKSVSLIGVVAVTSRPSACNVPVASQVTSCVTPCTLAVPLIVN